MLAARPDDEEAVTALRNALTLAVAMGAAASPPFHRWAAGGGDGHLADAVAEALGLVTGGIGALDEVRPRRLRRGSG